MIPAWKGFRPRLRAAALLVATLLLGTPIVAAAQQPTPLSETQRSRVLDALKALTQDTIRADSLGRDTLGVDTLGVDTVRVLSDSARSSLPTLPKDSVTRMLLALPGYQAVQYSGTEARFNADSSIILLQGPAQISREEEKLGADSVVVFNQATNIVCGYGKPVLQGGGATGANPVQSEQVCYDVNRKIGVARGARTQFTEGASWYLNGNVYTAGSDRIYGAGADFTTCDLEVPHYHFSAKELKVERNSVLVARDITLNFADVPVMWLPFMVQSLKRGRRSGLLMPQFSINDIARTNQGYNRRISNVGFYWAISDYLGAQVTGEWFANNWTSMQGTFDFRWLDQFLNGGATFRRYWNTDGSRQLTLSSDTRWQPSERTNLTLSANYASSSDFVKRNSFDPRELTRSIDSNVGATHRFDWGTLTMSGQRRQQLSDDRVDMTLPHLSLNVSSITLFPAPSDQARWYNNAVVTGNSSLNYKSTAYQGSLPISPSARESNDLTADMSTSLRLGKFSWDQNVSTARSIDLAKGAVPDTANPDSTLYAAIPETLDQSVKWSTGLSFQQRLIGTSSISPHLSISGDMSRFDPKSLYDRLGRDTLTTPAQDSAIVRELSAAYVQSPVRLNFGASLTTDVYGFFPGFGPFERFRHRVSPSFTYTYSPSPSPTLLQRAVYGASNVGETNQIGIMLRQSFEAKYKEKPDEADSTMTAPGDTTAAGAAELVPDTASGPRRLPQARKVTLLSITTSAVTYDFVQAREFGDGLATATLSNTITSDFLHGLSVQVSHDLFKLPTATEGGTLTQQDRIQGRKFSPYLTNLSTSFSFSGDSWLFKQLGLAGRKEEERPGGGRPVGQDTLNAMDEPTGTGISGSELGVMGRPTTNAPTRRPQGNIGEWNAQIGYSLQRSRGGNENQMIQALLTFQPTVNWNVSWRTGYSVTDHTFSDHYLSLTRNLHEWQASFDFVKAQNGNFQFRFRVQLTDLPDLHLDYDQRNQQGGGTAARPGAVR